MPLIGLGCSSGVRREHMEGALREGYRLLDTAQTRRWNYFESEAGEAVSACGVPRADIFLQTKIDPENLGYDATMRTFKASLSRLNTTYVDSVLLHKPRCWAGACRTWPEGTWQDSWRALEELFAAGLARHIGMCDVDDGLLDEMLRFKVRPHIVQNWMDPFHQDTAFRERCRREGVQYQGYSTLGPQWVHFRGHDANPVLEHAVLTRIAARHGRSVADVVLSWAVERGVAVIPASRSPARRAANLRAAEVRLSPEELGEIDSLDGTLDEGGDDASPSSLNVAFENAGSVALAVYFVDDDGGEVHVADIAPGGMLRQKTYVGHRFVFKAGSRAIDEHVVAEDDDEEPVVIDPAHSAGSGAEL